MQWVEDGKQGLPRCPEKQCTEKQASPGGQGHNFANKKLRHRGQPDRKVWILALALPLPRESGLEQAISPCSHFPHVTE